MTAKTALQYYIEIISSCRRLRGTAQCTIRYINHLRAFTISPTTICRFCVVRYKPEICIYKKSAKIQK